MQFNELLAWCGEWWGLRRGELLLRLIVTA